MKRSKNNKAPSSTLLKKLFRDMFKNMRQVFGKVQTFSLCVTLLPIFSELKMQC